MENLLLYILFALILFVVTAILRKWWDHFVIVMIAIGCSINANIFNSINYPVMVGNLTLGVDSMLYTIFLYMIFIKAIDQIWKARGLTVSAVAAILASAFIEFAAMSLYDGFTFARVQTLLMYFASCIGTVFGAYLMATLAKRLKNKMSVYFLLPLCLVVGCAINSIAYYGGYVIIYQQPIDNFISVLVGSFVGKGFCIILAELTFLLNNTIWTIHKRKSSEQNEE